MRPHVYPSVRARVLLCFVSFALVAAPAFAKAQEIAPAAAMLDTVRVLSGPDMEGRQAGTPGAEKAAEYVARAFREAGLSAAGERGTFLQPFSVPTGIKLGTPTSLSREGGSARAFALGTDFAPLATSESGAVSADVVFAGFGITAPALGYDDYAGIDVQGKVVLAIAGEPRSRDSANPFRRPDAYHYGEHSHKLINARQHGARAILLVAHPSAAERLPTLQGLSQSHGIIAAVVTRATADALLAGSGQTLATLASAIDGALAPRSVAAGTRARLEVTLVRERGTTANVIGVLPGTDARLRQETIVIGAHYDHLGRGGEGSLAPDEVGAIHHGADDNASGVAAVIALARAFAKGGGVARSLVFVAFGGEEMGLLGSAHYLKQAPLPVDRIAVMLNFDMVGRMREHKLYVGGADTGTGLRALMSDAAKDAPVDVELRGDPFAPSDHTTFYTAGRPVLFFFTGAHPDYHRPSDTWDKINADGLRTVTALAARAIDAVAAAPTPPAYVSVATNASARPRGAYGVFFGVIPLFGERTEPGVAISGVRAASPAERAGLQGGDVIVRFGDVDVKTLDDLMFALRGKQGGDRVTVVVQRGTQRQALDATLEERR